MTDRTGHEDASDLKEPVVPPRKRIEAAAVTLNTAARKGAIAWPAGDSPERTGGSAGSSSR